MPEPPKPSRFARQLAVVLDDNVNISVPTVLAFEEALASDPNNSADRNAYQGWLLERGCHTRAQEVAQKLLVQVTVPAAPDNGGRAGDSPEHVWKMPIFSTKRLLSVRGVEVTCFGYEPIVWVSLTAPWVTELPADATKFPAVLETGNTGPFLIREDHLLAWTGFRAADLPPDPRRSTLVDACGRRRQITKRAAKVWLHPYPEGRRLDPLDVEAGEVAIFAGSETNSGDEPPSTTGPHLPLLGMRQLLALGIQVFLDTQRLQLTVGKPGFKQTREYVKPTEELAVGPFHRQVIEDLRWAEDQSSSGAFQPFTGKYVAILNKEVKDSDSNVGQLLGRVSRTHPQVPRARFALFYVDPGE